MTDILYLPFLLQIMKSKAFPIVLATMLALLALFPEAESLEHRYRHMGDILFDDSDDELTQSSSNLRHDSTIRDNQNGRKRRGFARWNVPQEE